MRSLNQLLPIRGFIAWVQWVYFTKFWGMDVDRTVKISLSARLDQTYPKGVHIGPESYVAFDAAVLTHDRTRGLYLHTRIGKWCFIGAKSIILPGITIGDECIIGSGSVVTKDVPPRSIVAGNPARIIKSVEELGPYGCYVTADDMRRKLASEGAFD